MTCTTFNELVQRVAGPHPPRVWSLLVTVFGELAQKDAVSIPGPVLRQVTAPLGIKPEAMRVALHRLRKEGWIDSTRDGRISRYALTPWGRTQSAAANPVIYGREGVTGQLWLVQSDPSAPAPVLPDQAVWLSACQALAPHRLDDPNLLQTQLTAQSALPDWLRDKAVDPKLVQHCAELAERLTHLDAQPPQVLDPSEHAAFRVLVVHSWRRVALKAPRLPDFAFPEAWKGPDCRAKVGALLDSYPPQTIEALAQAASPEAD